VSQTTRLARALFRRFFETDLIPAGGDAGQTVIAFLTLLAAPGLLLPFRFSLKYVELAARAPDALPRALITDRLLFVTLTLIALGLVALVIWEGVFPDRRDARVLGALPIPDRVMIRARLLALAGLAGIFLLGTNTVPTLIYGSVLGISGGAATPVHGILAHLITNVAAGAFVFCGLIALQGLLLNLFGRRAAERLSIVLQLLFVVGLLQLVFFFPYLMSMVTTRISDLTSHPYLRLVPSVWFLGLYDVLGGNAQPGAWPLAIAALGATVAATSSSIFLLSATHGRVMRLALESRDSTGRSSSLTRTIAKFFNAYVVRRPLERALYAFTLKTLLRSRTHRMLMALYVGIALALSLSGLIPMLIRFGMPALATPGVFVLSVPLMVMFITLAGLRAVFALPIEPRANWVFRLLEPAKRTIAIDGVRDAMLIGAVAPIAGVAFVSGASLWGLWPGFVHGVTCFVLGWALSEALLVSLGKLPFTCTYYPGLSRMRTMWPVYLTAFSTFSYSTPLIEMAMMESTIGLVIFVTIIAAIVAVLRLVRTRRLNEVLGLRFQEEDPTAMFQGFQLSEALAASAFAPRASAGLARGDTQAGQNPGR
jgi:hypothetical protein